MRVVFGIFSMAIVKRLMLLLLVLSQMTVYSKDELEVVSLLRDFDENISLKVFTLMEDYKAHIYQVRNKNKCPEIARFDNPKYVETVYTVIPSEIIRCMLRENPYKDKSKRMDLFRLVNIPSRIITFCF